MQLEFTKMHALGNDFLVARGVTPPEPAVIRALAARRTGVGFDQLLWLQPPAAADQDIYYRVFNADGGEVEQCGNGARCIGRYLADAAGDANLERVWTLGVGDAAVRAQLQANGDVAVEMAVPDFTPGALPLLAPAGEQDTYTVSVGGEAVQFAAVSMGNPHAVLTVDAVATAPVERLGPLLEAHECFPNRANIGFMQVVDTAHIRLRVFERGVGETQACGTGACAAVAVGRRLGLLADDVTVALPGGELNVRWAGLGEPVWLVGEAVRAFDGVVAI